MAICQSTNWESLYIQRYNCMKYGTLPLPIKKDKINIKNAILFQDVLINAIIFFWWNIRFVFFTLFNYPIFLRALNTSLITHDSLFCLFLYLVAKKLLQNVFTVLYYFRSFFVFDIFTWLNCENFTKITVVQGEQI